MNILLYAPHLPLDSHLNVVKCEMKKLHAPTIRAYKCPLRNCYLAVEGSHRIKAAVDLGYKIKIKTVQLCDEITPNRLAYEILDDWRWSGGGAKYNVEVESKEEEVVVEEDNG